jgi:hypothetical protein
MFHLRHPDLSARYNPVGDFARVTEVATRIAGQLPSDGQSAAFKEFVWRFVNVMARALVVLGRKPDYEQINRYASNVDLHVGNMDGSATAGAHAVRAAENFGEEALQRHAFRQRMAMTAVRRGDGVRHFERRTDADRHGFLPDAQVQEPGDFAIGGHLTEPFFRSTNQCHALIQAEQSGIGDRFGHCHHPSAATFSRAVPSITLTSC